ncbi:MAG: hypothetical protein SH809_17235 [Rhodothermales bacterium]|nr:hypothetical protein [Rhodothermales bacterium]
MVAARDSISRLISFKVPEKAEPTPYVIRLTVWYDGDAESSAEAEVEVSVRPSSLADIQITEFPRHVRAGEPIRATILLHNRGNREITVLLSARGNLNWKSTLEASSIELPVGGSRQLALVVETPRLIPVTTHYALRVEASVRDAPEHTVDASTRIDVIPRAPHVPRVAREYPLATTLRTTGDQRGAGTQLEVTGRSRSPGGTTMDILLRAPDRRDRSSFGLRDEYRLAFSGDKGSLRLGDQTHVLSPLTEWGRYLFGAGGETSVGRFGIGAFHGQGRQTVGEQGQQTAFVRYRLNSITELSANALRRTGYVEGQAVTLRGVVRPALNTQIDTEVGVGRRLGKLTKAASFELVGNQSLIAYGARLVHADPLYPGYYSDLDLGSANLIFRPVRWLRFEGSWRAESRGFESESIADPANRTTRAYRFGGGLWRRVAQRSAFFDVYYDDQVQHVAQQDRTYTAIRVSSGFTAQGFGLTGVFEQGQNRLKSSGIDNTGTYQRIELRSRIEMPRIAYNLSVEHLDGQTRYSARQQQRWLANISANVTLSGRSRMDVSLYTSIEKNSRLPEYTQATIGYDHRLPFGHIISFKTRYNTFGGGIKHGSSDYALSYTVPLDVPTWREASPKMISGRVIDGETGLGISDVLLRLGKNHTLTDTEGKYQFLYPSAGTHYLFIDRSTIGLDRLPTQALPIELAISDKVTELDIMIVRSVSISGRVRQYFFVEGPEGGNGIQQSGGLAGIRVEISNGPEHFVQTTDRRGQFSYTDLRPGRWTLTIEPASLPLNHYIELKKNEYDLAPGANQHVDIKVLPKRKPIQIVQTGVLELKPVAPPSAGRVIAPTAGEEGGQNGLPLMKRPEERTEWPVGQLFLEYRILDKAGTRGVGEVYTAFDAEDGTLVHLMVLPYGLRHDNEARRRFVQEARGASTPDQSGLCAIVSPRETKENYLFVQMATCSEVVPVAHGQEVQQDQTRPSEGSRLVEPMPLWLKFVFMVGLLLLFLHLAGRLREARKG